MGIVFAILVGWFAHKAFQTRLFTGAYSLKQAFWGFGIAGGLAVLVLAATYVGHVMKSDQSSGGGWTLAAIRGVSTPIALYAAVTFIGIWRSARNSSFWIKIVSRYFSIFFFSTAGACLMIGWFNFLIAASVYGLKLHLQRKQIAKSPESLHDNT